MTYDQQLAQALQASQNPGSNVDPQAIAGVSNEDAMLNQAIMQSMAVNNDGLSPVTQEPLNPE